jgi:hypothetical protein
MCKMCDGTGIVVMMIETRVGCGGWFSTDGRVFTEDMQSCPDCQT